MSALKIWLLPKEGPKRVCKPPHAEAAYVLAIGACPACQYGEPGTLDKAFGPGAIVFKLAGTGQRYSADDRAYEADAVCLECKTCVGTLRAEPSTLFGVREDEAVLHGRVRVY